MARRTRKGRIPWTKDDVRYLRETFRNTSTAEIAKELRRSPASVQAKAFTLGLRKTRKYLKSIGKA